MARTKSFSSVLSRAYYLGNARGAGTGTWVLLWIFCLSCGVFGADIDKKATAATKADDSTVKFVELFLKTPTADLPPEQVPDFIAVNPAALPKKLQSGHRSKKEELLALKKIADGRKKPKVRRKGMAAPSSCTVDPPESLEMLKRAGYSELKEEDEQWLESKIKCTECEFMTEFTLRKVEKLKSKNHKSKAGGAEHVYLLHGKDFLWSLVAIHHQGADINFGTAFFGDGGTPRCH